MKILVTGATGFVGAVLIPELARDHGAAALTALVMPGDRIPCSWAGLGVRVLYADIADAAAVRAAVAGHSHVIHMAGLISYWKRDRRLLDRVNREGVRCLVDAGRRAPGQGRRDRAAAAWLRSRLHPRPGLLAWAAA